MCTETLKKRKDFLRVAEGIKVVTSSIILQATLSLSAPNSSENPPRIGFTTSKRIGKAHVRNRARRRLRALVRELFPTLAMDNVEYVFVGRHNTAEIEFETLRRDMRYGLKKIRETISPNSKNAKKNN